MASQLKTGVSYFGVRNPEFAKVDLQIIASLEYTHILHTLSEEDFEYHQESMKEIIERSVAYGLKVYVSPWGIGRVFGGEAYSEFAGRNPSSAQKDNSESRVVASCPNSPIFKEYLFKWIDFVCSLEIDTVFWDEPHFYFDPNSPESWACSCDICQKKYRQEYQHSMPSSLTESIEKFRSDSLYKFMNELTEEVHKHGKRNALCLHPKDHVREKDNWPILATLPHVDELSTEPLWPAGNKTTEITQSYHKTSKYLQELCEANEKEAQIWIKNYNIHKNTEESIVAASYAAFNEGIRNIFCWSYLGSKYLSKLKSDDHEKVWAIQTETFGELRNKL